MWKMVPGSTRYRVSDQGIVESCVSGVWRRLRPFARKAGHLSVRTYPDAGRRQKVYVHTLVLETFVGPCPPGMQCHHRNGDVADNRLENLYWGPRKMPASRGELNGRAVLDPQRVVEIRCLLESGEKPRNIAPRFGVSRRTIYNIRSGRTWSR